MIHEARFVFSKGQYAVRPTSFSVTPNEGGRSAYVRIEAVWYRGKLTAPKAVIGYLWDYVRAPWPTGYQAFLEQFDDGRYGGNALGRWDGTSYYSHEGTVPEVQEQHMAVLGPMLDGMPLVPGGYEAWWRFPTTRELEKARTRK